MGPRGGEECVWIFRDVVALMLLFSPSVFLFHFSLFFPFRFSKGLKEGARGKLLDLIVDSVLS